MSSPYFTLKNAAAPNLAFIRRTALVDMHVKLRGGVHDYYDWFWVKVTKVEGDNLFGEVANHICIPCHAADRGIGIPALGTVIAFKMQHIYQSPIIVSPVGMKVCEIQVCAMHNDVNGGVLADSGYEGGPLEVNGYDVLVRYCDIADDPAEPEDVLHFDEWGFEFAHDASDFANYLANTYTPDFEPEWI